MADSKQEPWDSAPPGEPWEQPAPAKAAESSMPKSWLADVTEQMGVGLTKAATGFAGMFGDAREMSKTAEGKAQRALGVEGMPKASSLLFPFAPTSKTLEQGLHSITGEPPKPTGLSGEYARTFGEFMPMIFGGEAGFMARIARAVFPAAGSETAGQLAKDTPYEGIARLGGALTPATIQFMWRQAPERMEGAMRYLFDAAKKNYQHPDVTDLKIKTPAVQAEGIRIYDELYNKEGLRELTSPGTAGALKELMFMPPKQGRMASITGQTAWPFVTMDDIQSVRTVLRNVAGNFNNPTDQRHALMALEQLDAFLPKLKQADLLGGDAAKAVPRLTDARKDWWGARSLEAVGDEIYSAEMRNAAAFSGQNLENKVRSRMASILTNDKERARFTDREIEMMEQIVQGHPIENLMRRISKLIPRHGALGLGLAAGSTHVFGPVGLGIQAAGEVAASVENKIANKLVRNLQDEIVNRSAQGEKGYKAPRREIPDFTTPSILARPSDPNDFSSYLSGL